MILQALGLISYVLRRTVRIQPLRFGGFSLQATLHVSIAPPCLHQVFLKSHYSTKTVVHGPNMWPWLSGAHVARGAANNEFRARVQYSENGDPHVTKGPRRPSECHARADLELIIAAAASLPGRAERFEAMGAEAHRLQECL